MQTVHTDLSQINDFNLMALSHGFELIDVTDEVKERHADGGLQAVEAERDASHDIPAGDVLHLVFRQGFDILAPNWRVTDAEVGQLVGAYEPVIEKYNLADKLTLGVEANAILTTLIIFAPRMRVPRQVVEVKATQSNETISNERPLGDFNEG